ncbi:MAG: hypothetical protein ACFB2W_06955 [Leptolyngbyaceae cyanobacterium]
MEQGTPPKVLEALKPASEAAPLVHQGTNQTTWHSELRRRWRWAVGGSIAVVALCGTAALMSDGPGQEIKGRSGAVAPNKEALLVLTEQDYDALNAQVQLQIDESYGRLIDLEAVRFLAEAEKQIVDDTKPCYRAGASCVLDQFESDALVMYRQGADTLNRQLQLDALLRLQVVERARSGLRVADEPDNALTAAAIQRRLDARQLTRAAAAESQAAELLED